MLSAADNRCTRQPAGAMVFKSKFFLDLSGGEELKPVQVAPVRPADSDQPAPAAKGPAAATPAAGEGISAKPAAAPAAASSGTSATPGSAEGSTEGSSLTTTEAIAAELAAAQANRPAPSTATFAPECVVAGGAIPRSRRSAGANLGAFKEMAKGMMRS
jgi:hypothetical protein